MNLNEKFPVSPKKREALLARIQHLQIDLKKIKERFVRGSGCGGQKINKTANCVVLQYAPLNITVKVQRERQRSLNRFLALRELLDRIEMQISPGASPRLKKIDKIRKQKAREKRRFLKKMEAKANLAETKQPHLFPEQVQL